jgi:hypothetical protein
MEINMKNYNLESFKEKDIYSWEEIISIIEDLECELHIKEEKIEELENDLESNYKKISLAEQYDISDRDFI